MIRRKPSLTESIASALDSFAFLTSDDEDDINTKNDTRKKHMSSELPYQMHLYYTTFRHHLHSINDLVVAFQSASGPLNSKETFYFDRLRQQCGLIKEISHLVSMTDDLTLKLGEFFSFLLALYRLNDESVAWWNKRRYRRHHQYPVSASIVSFLDIPYVKFSLDNIY